MPSLKLRRYNRAVLEAELAGKSHYAGPPCKRYVEHVEANGSTKRDTVRRTCNLCENLKLDSWRGRQTCPPT